MESFLTGRLTITGEKTASTGTTSNVFQSLFAQSDAASGNRSAHHAGCDDQVAPKIDVINGPNGVERIVITCTCGKRIELKCDYD